MEKSEKQNATGFALSDEGDIPPVDFSKYEKRRFHDSQGREIAVFDGLVDQSDLDALRLFLLHYNSAFAYQPFDGADEEHDNVSWIAMLKVNKLIFNYSRFYFWQPKSVFMSKHVQYRENLSSNLQ